MGGEGNFAEQIFQRFQVARRKAGSQESDPELSPANFRRPEGVQLGLGLQAQKSCQRIASAPLRTRTANKMNYAGALSEILFEVREDETA